MTPKIRLRNLHKRFGDKVVLDGIDLDVMPGTSMVVIGGSGSGKSVLLKCILGLIEPDAGSIEIDGGDILRLPRHEREAVRSRIGMLFQNGALFDSLPVWENVAFGLLVSLGVGFWRASTPPPRRGARSRRRLPGRGRPGPQRRRTLSGGAVRRHAEARGAGPRHRRAAGHHVFR
jgi:phospholipid/cholesterol/gamma-HCH transport system ATP-binding protein